MSVLSRFRYTRLSDLVRSANFTTSHAGPDCDILRSAERDVRSRGWGYLFAGEISEHSSRRWRSGGRRRYPTPWSEDRHVLSLGFRPSQLGSCGELVSSCEDGFNERERRYFLCSFPCGFARSELRSAFWDFRDDAQLFGRDQPTSVGAGQEPQERCYYFDSCGSRCCACIGRERLILLVHVGQAPHRHL